MKYKRWHGIRARDVKRARADGVLAIGPTWVEFKDDLLHDILWNNEPITVLGTDGLMHLRTLQAYDK